MYKTISKGILTGTIDVEGLTTFSYPTIPTNRKVNSPAGGDNAGKFISSVNTIGGVY